MKRAFTGLFVLLLLVLPIQAQNKPGPAAVKLAWHFTKGSEFHFRRTTLIKQAIDMGAMGKSGSNTKTTYHMKFEVLDVADKNVTTIRASYLRGQLEYKDDKGKETIYDTANPDDQRKESEPICKVIRAYVGNAFSYSIDETGKVLEIKDYDTIYKNVLKAVGAQPGLPEEQYEASFGVSAIKRQLELSFHMLPDAEVSKGDQWTRSHDQPAPPLGTLKYELACTFKGMKTERGYSAAHISIEAEPSIVPNAKKEGDPPQPFEFKLESAKMTGNYFFLPASSQFLKAEFKEQMVLLADLGDDMKLKVNVETENTDLLMTADEIKKEEADVKALAEGKKTETPEKEPEKNDTPPVPVPDKK